MFSPFLGPFAHFSFDDSGIDAVASRWDDFLGHLLDQQTIPSLTAALAGRTLGQATAQDFQRGGKGHTLWIEVLSAGGFLHQYPHQVMGQHQAIDFLEHAGGGLTAQYGAFALVGLQLVDGQFFFPTRVVQTDQGRGRVEFRVEQSGQQPMPLGTIGASRIVERVLNDPHPDAITVVGVDQRGCGRAWPDKSRRPRPQ